MKAFAQLFYDLDQTNKTNDKVAIMVQYFKDVSEEDIYHTLALFTGRRPKRVVNSTQIRTWAAEYANVPLWLFEECYTIVGDLSETVSLLLPEGPEAGVEDLPLLYWLNFLKSLSKMDEAGRKEALFEAWRGMTSQEKFVFSKLTSSTFRVGVSQNLIVRSLSIFSGVPGAKLSHRLMGDWDRHSSTYQELVHGGDKEDDTSRPYPFCLAYPLESKAETLGEPQAWQAEWKWDGIRAQVILRGGQFYVWSRGEELITDKFPEFEGLKMRLPASCVIDGEILPHKDGKPLTFNILQTRIGRKVLSPKILASAPAMLFAYDLMELDGEDLREHPLEERRAKLEKIVNDTACFPLLQISPKVDFVSWDALAEKRLEARQNLSEGLMLKRKESAYGVGRKKGDWWKWKLDPLSIDAVMIYAQRGSGRRANLYTDYTFAVWNEKELVPFAKAYSGLTDKEIGEVDRWIKANTVDKYGPVRTVKPGQVFEIGFEGIAKSNRHKSGIALRFPRILRWRKDKLIGEADTLETLAKILQVYEEPQG